MKRCLPVKKVLTKMGDPKKSGTASSIRGCFSVNKKSAVFRDDEDPGAEDPFEWHWPGW